MATNGGTGAAGTAKREDDAIYQKDRDGRQRRVARVADVHVDEAGKEILFGEISESDDLLLPEPCAYQKWTIVVRKIAHATAHDKANPQRGRVLKGVTAEIVGRVDQ